MNQKKYMYWYYNLRYSETGGVFDNLDRAILFMKHDSSVIINEDDVRNSMQNRNKYEDLLCKLVKIMDYGEVDSGEHPILWKLRYPESIYSKQEDAIKRGLVYVLSNLDNIRYYWSRHNDWDNRRKTTCNIEWLEEILSRPLDASKSLCDVINGITKLEELQKIWKARIDEDQWTDSLNHIETIHSGKIYLN